MVCQLLSDNGISLITSLIIPVTIDRELSCVVNIHLSAWFVFKSVRFTRAPIGEEWPGVVNPAPVVGLGIEAQPNPNTLH